MDVVTVNNIALAEVGNRTSINSLDDNTPAANVASLFYSPKTKALLRAANWDFARKQVTLTLFKSVTVNGVASSNPPPSPFQYSYIYPADCLKARFIVPSPQNVPAGVPLTTGVSTLSLPQSTVTKIPFVVGSDISDGQPIKTIMTNLPNAQLVYTQDLSLVPDMWDDLFLTAETAMLAAYFINALARNQAQMNAQIAIAKNALDQARAINANEAITNADHVPDFLAVRFQGGWDSAGWGSGPNGIAFCGDYDSLSMPDGLSY